MTSGKKRIYRRHARDQAASRFTPILSDLVARVPRARAAALVDDEGETVDYAGVLPPYDIRVAAAQWQIVIAQARARLSPNVACIVVRTEGAGCEVYALPERYALIVLLSKSTALKVSRRAVAACCHALSKEASWPLRGMPAWFPATVAVDRQARPVAIGSGHDRRSLEIVGVVAAGLNEDEQGFRVRVVDGVEATLVREPGELWYVDELDLSDAGRPRSRE